MDPTCPTPPVTALQSRRDWSEVAAPRSQLTDADICALPVPRLQTAGFLFVWVVNAKFKFALDLFELWGYE